MTEAKKALIERLFAQQGGALRAFLLRRTRAHPGEQATYRLADSSALHLNTDSSVTIRYSDAERRVVLESGEADFEVVHQPGRAFRVIVTDRWTLQLTGSNLTDVYGPSNISAAQFIKGNIPLRPRVVMAQFSYRF